jgi:hypothetical protein
VKIAAMKMTMKKLMWMPGNARPKADSTGVRMWIPLPPLTLGNCWEPSQPMTNAPIA